MTFNVVLGFASLSLLRPIVWMMAWRVAWNESMVVPCVSWIVVSDSGVAGAWMTGLGALVGVVGTWMLGLGRVGVGELGPSSSSSAGAVALVAGFLGAGGAVSFNGPLVGDLEVFVDGAKPSNSFLVLSTTIWSPTFSLSLAVDIFFVGGKR
jgi:hypothetical protein